MVAAALGFAQKVWKSFFKSNIKSLSSIALKIYVFITYILIISISGNCNPFGCDCIYEHCGGWLPWCDPNEMCADKKRNMMEVHTKWSYQNVFILLRNIENNINIWREILKSILETIEIPMYGLTGLILIRIDPLPLKNLVLH